MEYRQGGELFQETFATLSWEMYGTESCDGNTSLMRADTDVTAELAADVQLPD